MRCLDSGQKSEQEFSRSSSFELRWFTPQIEVPLCGHATLAAAAALANECENEAAELSFQTKSGLLKVTRDGTRFRMALPFFLPGTKLPSPDFERTSSLLKALFSGACRDGASVESLVDEICYEPRLRYLLISLKEQGLMGRVRLESLHPDYGALQEAHKDGMLVGIIVTSHADPRREETKGKQDWYSFFSRFFGPWAGIPEDPVTGSAHSVLGPYVVYRPGVLMNV